MPMLFAHRPRRFLAVGALVAVVVAGVGSLIAAGQTRAAIGRAQDAVVSAAVRLAAVAPDHAEEIARALTDSEASGNLEAGRQELARYGITADILTIAGPLAGLARSTALTAFVVAALAGAAALAFGAGAVSRLLAAVEAVARSAEDIAAGRYVLSPAGEVEGTVARLEHQIRRTAHRLASEAQAADLERRKTADFLADVSHQLKTPIASLRMYLELLLHSPERQDFVTRGLAQVDRVEWLVRNLLTIERIQAGTLSLTFVTTPLDPVLRDLVEQYAPIAHKAGVELRLELPRQAKGSDPPHDPRWLSEAVGNVVKNAIEHTPAEGSVTVTLERTSLFSRIRVDDTGRGIALEDLPHVFDRFYRGRTTEAGTGIGLSLARAVVEKHGGHIAAVPRRGGARFLITLPYETVSRAVTES